MKNILVTGAAGFIGYHLVSNLVFEKYNIVGVDNINEYYDVELKYSRLSQNGINAKGKDYGVFIQSSLHENYRFVKMDLADKDSILKIMELEKFHIVINLAAQAGVRYSLDNPESYLNSNVLGFHNILEGSKVNQVEHLIYASTSSVYGLNRALPFCERHTTDHPMSLYAATKKTNELFAHTYSHLFGVPTTGLRFFTVYGSWGRPDMALYIFADAMINDKPLQLFNNGEMIRDFTHISDVTSAIKGLLERPPMENSNWDFFNPTLGKSSAPFRIFNVGNSKPVNIIDYVKSLERNLGIVAKLEFQKMQPGDVYSTHADVKELFEYSGFTPQTSIDDGIKEFTQWYVRHKSHNSIKDNKKT